MASSEQVILKEGIYASFDSQWKSLRDDQIEAVNDFLENVSDDLIIICSSRILA